MNRKLKAKIFEVFGTQADFSLVVKVDEAKISKVVRGRRALSEDEQNRWAGLLGATPVELFKE